jgi:predicted HAD superfamily Cof-like phosphohydrolase
MTKEQTLVTEFMQTFGQETPPKPIIPSFEIRKLRAKLIFEEALETIEALGFTPRLKIEQDSIQDLPITNNSVFMGNSAYEPSLVEIADGLADLHYVAYCGTAEACGLDMQPIFEEVHRSNMSKLWTTEEVSTPDSYPESYTAEQVSYPHPQDVHIKCWLVKDKDGKVIKSPSYSPANLQPLIEEQKK